MSIFLDGMNQIQSTQLIFLGKKRKDHSQIDTGEDKITRVGTRENFCNGPTVPSLQVNHKNDIFWISDGFNQRFYLGHRLFSGDLLITETMQVFFMPQN